MLYQNIVSSNTNALPSKYEDYKFSFEQRETKQQGNNKVAEATVHWNTKVYTFKWCTSLTDEEITKQIKDKIETMLALGIRYELGNKTTSIKYNLADHTVERQKEKGETKKSDLNFDEQSKHLEEKIKKLGAEPEKKAELEKLQYRKQRILWAKSMFETVLKQPDISPAVLEKNHRKKPTVEVKREDNLEQTTAATTTTTTSTSPFPSVTPNTQSKQTREKEPADEFFSLNEQPDYESDEEEEIFGGLNTSTETTQLPKDEVVINETQPEPVKTAEPPQTGYKKHMNQAMNQAKDKLGNFYDFMKYMN